jgi:hypothetical protein
MKIGSESVRGRDHTRNKGGGFVFAFSHKAIVNLAIMRSKRTHLKVLTDVYV